MIFNNISAFEQRMIVQGVDVAFFTIQYHNCAIETAYSRTQKKFLFAFDYFFEIALSFFKYIRV